MCAEMVAAAAAEGGKPVVLINPKLGDIQSAGGVMSVRGRQQRLDFAATFCTSYHFRLLYKGVAMHPIMGALRHEYGGPWEVGARRSGCWERVGGWEGWLGGTAAGLGSLCVCL